MAGVTIYAVSIHFMWHRRPAFPGETMFTPRPILLRLSVFLALVATSFAAPAQVALAQEKESRWAAKDDPVAKALIELERKWAEAGCTHNGIEANILADDFHGVAPDGSQYDKSKAVQQSQSTAPPERECKMFEVKVHFYGDTVAVLYGSESAIHPGTSKHGEHTIKLTWTDTWLMRNGKWQIVAAEDMPTVLK